MIEVINVSKSFGTKKILNNISTSFLPGKTNLIIGRSGSGKTVLLKSIVGLHDIDDGEIRYDERIFSKMGNKDKRDIRKEIGMVFQGSALFDSLTILENVMFPLEMFTKLNRKEKIEVATSSLCRVNLTNVNELYPAEISGGMQKRVAIARAIVLNPRYLFFDEPNSGLDPQTSLVIDKLIKDITEEYGITTVINTHDMNSVMEIGDKIVFIHLGEKGWEGSNKEIVRCENKDLIDFVFASDLYKKIRKLAE